MLDGCSGTILCAYVAPALALFLSLELLDDGKTQMTGLADVGDGVTAALGIPSVVGEPLCEQLRVASSVVIAVFVDERESERPLKGHSMTKGTACVSEA